MRYIKRLQYPALEAAPALTYEARTRQGARFHKLVQQHLLGTPADLLAHSLGDDAELADWWATFRATGLAGLPPGYHAEVTLQTQLGGRRLIAKYDLLALEPGGQALIVDWKTWQPAIAASPAKPPANHPLSLCACASRRASLWRAAHSAGEYPHDLLSGRARGATHRLLLFR